MVSASTELRPRMCATFRIGANGLRNSCPRMARKSSLRRSASRSDRSARLRAETSSINAKQPRTAPSADVRDVVHRHLARPAGVWNRLFEKHTCSLHRAFQAWPYHIERFSAEDLAHVPPDYVRRSLAEPGLISLVGKPVGAVGCDIGNERGHRIGDQPQLRRALRLALALCGGAQGDELGTRTALQLMHQHGGQRRDQQEKHDVCPHCKGGASCGQVVNQNVAASGVRTLASRPAPRPPR